MDRHRKRSIKNGLICSGLLLFVAAVAFVLPALVIPYLSPI